MAECSVWIRTRLSAFAFSCNKNSPNVTCLIFMPWTKMGLYVFYDSFYTRTHGGKSILVSKEMLFR